ncbi:hypothetical protein GCK72_002297 [Caenorhabditis remanei]|uniref:Uncharacterized protein n=1 Tax=Caenorhabditis remanei TaxID=31234 RepID=A0A2P4VLG3_CAERE|nr:hypothetical protein GCK72_002297 [Caenorhabditis remanei]KAF1770478.1 hypothetical protein GCK72_002297 [Caenorhabditis remanei]
MTEPKSPLETKDTKVEPTNVREIDLNDGLGFTLDESILYSRLKSIGKVIMKLIVLTICVSACCALFFYEAVTVSLTTPILTLEEMKQLEDEEARMHLKCFILLLWSFAVYTLITEMMTIMLLNDKIRILESMRHRTKMEAILSLIRQKSYYDADAVEFILENAASYKTDAVSDEMEVKDMVYHRVHGLNPHRSFYYPDH